MKEQIQISHEVNHVDVKPCRAEVYLLYKCPNCDSEHPINDQEILSGRRTLYCYCGYVLHFKQVENIKVNVEYKVTESQPTQPDETVYDDLLKGIVYMGYDKTTANRIISEVKREYSGESDKNVLWSHIMDKLND